MTVNNCGTQNSTEQLW